MHRVVSTWLLAYAHENVHEYEDVHEDEDEYVLRVAPYRAIGRLGDIGPVPLAPRGEHVLSGGRVLGVGQADEGEAEATPTRSVRHSPPARPSGKA